LRTWANKRDRIQVFSAASLFEFSSAAELDDAMARGLPAMRVSDRLAVVRDESAVDFRHFRLTATRDFGLPPEKCATVESDGVTVCVDPARADLLMETELARFAEPVDAGANGRRCYRLTPRSLLAARAAGWTLASLQQWFAERTGAPMPAAAQLLLTGCELAPWEFQRPLVLRVPTAEMADGLEQWPETRALIRGRLGPTALIIAEDQRANLEERLRALGMTPIGPG
jgi:hypothetical protein